MNFKTIKEFLIEKLILLCGLTSIIMVLLIFIFLAKEGLALFKSIHVSDFLLGHKWYPISDPPRFGIFPLILGSLYVTLGATLLSVPLGVASAVYIAEIASPKTKEILKTGIEILAAIPRVALPLSTLSRILCWNSFIFGKAKKWWASSSMTPASYFERKTGRSFPFFSFPTEATFNTVRSAVFFVSVTFARKVWPKERLGKRCPLSLFNKTWLAWKRWGQT